MLFRIPPLIRAIPVVALTLGILLAAVEARALTALAENTYINDRLVAAQIGDIIRKTCPEEIGARMIYAVNEARKLKNYALKQGYTDDQIDDFVTSKVEKARVRALADAYMADNGVVKGDVASYCALGRSEIERGSIAGSLIYEK
jgi:hypothetical protein